jgi:hypothetical protein
MDCALARATDLFALFLARYMRGERVIFSTQPRYVFATSTACHPYTKSKGSSALDFPSQLSLPVQLLPSSHNAMLDKSIHSLPHNFSNPLHISPYS